MNREELESVLYFAEGNVDEAVKLLQDLDVKGVLAGPRIKNTKRRGHSGNERMTDDLYILKILMQSDSSEEANIFKEAKKLEELTLSDEVLEELQSKELEIMPFQIHYFKNVKTFTCSDLELNELPENIWRLAQLENLDCSLNEIVTFPEEIKYMKRLEILDCSDNEIVTLPEEIKHMERLEILDCSDNEIVTFPEEIGGMTQLKNLDCHTNRLKNLPMNIGKLTQLRKLDCRSNQLTSLPDSIGQLTQLQKLDCSNNQLTSLPDSIGQLTQLQKLDCGSNQLTSLPDSIGQLKQLQELDCDKNQLTSLPDSIGQLTQLTYLQCEDNQLTSLPDSIGQLTQLEEFYYEDNPLYLPKRSELEKVKSSQRNERIIESTLELAQNTKSMVEFMEAVVLKPFLLTLEGSNMFLIHFDGQSRVDRENNYLLDVLNFLEAPENKRFDFANESRPYFLKKREGVFTSKDPHLLVLVSVNNNSLFLNGFLIGTFSAEDFSYAVDEKLKFNKQDYAEIKFLNTAKPLSEVSQYYFADNNSYYFGSLLVKIFEWLTFTKGKTFLILHSVSTAVPFYEKLGFELFDEDYNLFVKRASYWATSSRSWLDVLQKRRELIEEALVLSQGNVVAAAQLMWHRFLL